MKRLTLALLASLALAPAAFAADMPLKAPAQVAVASGSGFYIGVNAGAAAAMSEYQYITMPGGSNTKLFPAGAMTGATVGFGGSLGGLYAAIESDFDYDFTAAETACAYPATAKLTVNTHCGAKNSWLLTQRVVLGIPLSGITGAVAGKIPTSIVPPSQWPIPISAPTNFSASNIMPFVTGGIAERNVSAFVDKAGYGPDVKGVQSQFSGGSASEWMVGYLVGGGVRIPLASGLSAKVEYDYIGFNKSFVPAGSSLPLFSPATFKQVNEQRLIAGVDFHL